MDQESFFRLLAQLSVPAKETVRNVIRSENKDICISPLKSEEFSKLNPCTACATQTVGNYREKTQPLKKLVPDYRAFSPCRMR
jgi:hypothetical protein